MRAERGTSERSTMGMDFARAPVLPFRGREPNGMKSGAVAGTGLGADNVDPETRIESCPLCFEFLDPASFYHHNSSQHGQL
jgi:hypothetical protein